ncbi:MAG: hypothetical protein GY814_14665, partial [Gammaproteobacteria bacterium]|nr:hypothetical protein [Gammaproteobacteria bacterium]
VVKARLDKKTYIKGKKVTNYEMENLRISKNKFHGEWNYTIKPENVKLQEAQVIL